MSNANELKTAIESLTRYKAPYGMEGGGCYEDVNGDLLDRDEVLAVVSAALADEAEDGLLSLVASLVDDLQCTIDLYERVGPHITTSDGGYLDCEVVLCHAEKLAAIRQRLSALGIAKEQGQ